MRASIIVDSRLKKNIESLYEYKGGSCSIKFKDIDDTFWFDNREKLQEFVHVQARERYYDKIFRLNYFDYTNEHNEKIRYDIIRNTRGKLEVIENV